MDQLFESFKDVPGPLLLSTGISFGSRGLIALLVIALGIYSWRLDSISGGAMVGAGVARAVLPICYFVASSWVPPTTSGSSSGFVDWYRWSAVLQGSYAIVSFGVELIFLLSV